MGDCWLKWLRKNDPYHHLVTVHDDDKVNDSGAYDELTDYRDVTLDVTLTRPDGSQVKWWGFYDGDGIWRMRFLPDQIGVWRYEARFVGQASSLPDSSDLENTAGWKPTPRDGSAGSFECVASDSPGMWTTS